MPTASNQSLSHWSGCAITILDSLSEFRSVLSSELFAIKLAVATALNFKEPCLICSDSLNSLRCLTKYRDHRELNHKGIVQDKLVDRAAKQASTCFLIQNLSLPLYSRESSKMHLQ